MALSGGALTVLSCRRLSCVCAGGNGNSSNDVIVATIVEQSGAPNPSCVTVWALGSGATTYKLSLRQVAEPDSAQPVRMVVAEGLAVPIDKAVEPLANFGLEIPSVMRSALASGKIAVTVTVAPL